MDCDELRKAVFSIVKDDDPYKESKQLQLKNWCGAFWKYLTVGVKKTSVLFGYIIK